ncbi:MAG: UPF0175 family protein [Candidatus Competibacteraceae bacterium]
MNTHDLRRELALALYAQNRLSLGKARELASRTGACGSFGSGSVCGASRPTTTPATCKTISRPCVSWAASS